MSALINRHNMVDRTPENVWCLGGTLLPSDIPSPQHSAYLVAPLGEVLQLFSHQDKLVRLCTSFTPSE